MPLKLGPNKISLAERQATGNCQVTRQESARERPVAGASPKRSFYPVPIPGVGSSSTTGWHPRAGSAVVGDVARIDTNGAHSRRQCYERPSTEEEDVLYRAKIKGSLEQAAAGSAVLGKRASAKRARQLLTRLLRGHVNGLWEFDDARLTMSELRAIAQLDPEEGPRRARLLVLRPDVGEMTGILIWRRIVNRLAIPETIMAILDQAESRRSFTKVQESAMPSQDLRRQANAIIRREAWVGDYRVSETSRVAECRPRKGRIVVLMSTVEEESCETASSS